MQNYECKEVDILYTAKLLNRMNGACIIRSGSMSIFDAEAKFGENAYRLNVDNIANWTIFNKNNVMSPTINAGASGNVITKYIREFYDTTSIQMQDSAEGTYYNTNEVQIIIYQAAHNYKFEFVVTDPKTGTVR